MFAALPIASLFLLATPGAPVAYPNLGALIDKIGTQLEAQVGATLQGAQTLRVRKEELDSDGKVSDVSEELLRAKGEGEALEFELVRATENGKDGTAERLAERADSKTKHGEAKGHPGHGDHEHGDHDLRDINPFTQRAKYRYWVVAPLPPAGQPLHVHFEPGVEPVPELVTGDALVDPATGNLLQATFAPSSLPMMVQTLKMKVVMGTAGKAPGATELSVDGRGGLLFWHKHFRVHLWFTPKAT
jgi:hypothetical protein